ncbi:hypothetical protein WN943_021321 [Citrus x changshan-huyou]
MIGSRYRMNAASNSSRPKLYRTFRNQEHVTVPGERWLQDVHNLENHVNDSREVHRFQMPVLSWSPP